MLLRAVSACGGRVGSFHVTSHFVLQICRTVFPSSTSRELMSVLRPHVLRQAARFSANRSGVSIRSFTSSVSLCQQDAERASRRPKPIPESPSFYTTRAVYYDQMMHLEKAISKSETFLRQNYLLPLPEFARASLPPLNPVWKDQAEMAAEFQTKLTTTRYRRVTKLLNQINDFQRVAAVGGCPELAEKLNNILAMYESSKKEALLNRGKRKTVVLDEFGRSYTVGKRKTSGARVWMIPVQRAQEPSPEAVLGIMETQPTFSVTASTILVNNLPIHEFFPLPADRERITRPLKVAGALGKYNIFTIVRGGGTSGQSGAIAQGIAKGIVAHEPELETMFRRGAFLFGYCILCHF